MNRFDGKFSAPSARCGSLRLAVARCGSLRLAAARCGSLLAAAHFSDGGLQYCLDLITPPDWARTITSMDGSTSELNMKSFLHSAVQGGNVEIVTHLADLCIGCGDVGALNRQDTLGRTPFQLACKYGKLDCANILWYRAEHASFAIEEMGKTADADGQSPFHAACEFGSIDLVIWLYGLGVDIEKPGVGLFRVDSTGTEAVVRLRTSPLVCATLYRHKDIVALLLGWGANRNATAEAIGDSERTEDTAFDGKKPIEIAMIQDDEDLATLMHSTKRHRCKIPVKERAKKAGVQLPPTPDGIRREIEHGSPNTKRKAKVTLQHHQQACQQKVQRVEIAKDCHAPHAKRKRKLRSAGDKARYAKKHGANQEKPDFL